MKNVIIISTTAAVMFFAAGEANATYITSTQTNAPFAKVIEELHSLPKIDNLGHTTLVQVVSKALEFAPRANLAANREAPLVLKVASADRTW